VKYIPTAVGGLSGKIIAAISGTTHSLMLTSTGDLYAAGNNDNGQLGGKNNITCANKKMVPLLKKHYLY
jgi:alpha-tubulin suppressor-like RCC1 family protein